MTTTLFRAAGKTPLRFLLITSLVLITTATTSRAGFEWVPAAKQEPNLPMPAPVSPTDEALPLPEPVSAQAPEVKPSETLVVPEAQLDPAIKTKSFITVPAEQPEQTTPVQPAAKQPEAPANEVLPETLTQPPVIHTRVITPEDTPESAKEELPKLEILPNPVIAGPAPQMDIPDAQDLPEVMAPPAMEKAKAQSSGPAFDHFETIQGFGTDIPLAIALTQIVPPGYSYSFGETVNPGTKISWNGGKPWPAVIEDMIAPLGLNLSLRGKMVFIGHASHSALSPQLSAPLETEEHAALDLNDGDLPAKAALRRAIIADPGEDGAQQPAQTLDMIKETIIAQGETPEPSNIAEPADQTAEQMWQAHKGDSLKRTLDEWSRKANYDLQWESSHDYTIGADVQINGDLKRAVHAIFDDAVEEGEKPSLSFVAAPDRTQNGRILIREDQKG